MSSLINVPEEEVSHKIKRCEKSIDDPIGDSCDYSEENVSGKKSGPSTPTCIAKMGESMEQVWSFKEGHSQADLRARPESYLSMKSEPFTDEEDTLGEGTQIIALRKRWDPFAPINVSMRSEQSMDFPVNFGGRHSHRDLSLIHRDRPESYSSMRSEQHMDDPDGHGEGNIFVDSSPRERHESATSHLSTRSDESVDNSCRDAGVNPSPRLKRSISRTKSRDYTFKELENRAISLLKTELKRFEGMLCPDTPEYSEEEVEEEEEDLREVRQGLLKITLHILRKMDRNNMASVLESKMTPLYQQNFKSNLKRTFQSIKEGTSKQQNSSALNEIYTELYITEAGSEEINNDHEIRHIEETSRKEALQQTTIKVNDIFRALPGQDKPIRTVLTKGVAGIGKTVSVQKFILDWSDGKANQDVQFIFPLPFRELNLLKGKNFSLKDLLHRFFSETAELALKGWNAYKVMFIFDGLDECRLSLDFHNNERVTDVTKRSSADVLLTNLIKGNLLPSALIWITSRPAACGLIPPEYIDQVTEVRGFSDLQKEEYFRKRIQDQSVANRIITHMKSSRSLYIMCHIPVFCWIAATVLEKELRQAASGETPKTLTQMFTQFLIFQSTQWSQKYQGTLKSHSDQTRESILALGKLAFQQLDKGNLIFYEEDLRDCGIDVREVSVYSGLCTQIFREELGLHIGKVFSFVHLSVQEFLAALYVLVSFLTSNRKELEKQVPGFVSTIHKPTMSDFLKSVVNKALQSDNGHLDLFLRFLLGLSMDFNETLLQGLLIQTGKFSHKEETVKYIKKMIREVTSPEKSINLFHCLNELNDRSLVQEVQMYLNRRGKNRLTTANLSPAQWSALVFVLLNSEKTPEEFNLSNYDPSEECFLKLLPVVKASRKASLDGCNLTEKSCGALGSALSSSNLRELDLSTNDLKDSGVTLLFPQLSNSQCKLEILKLCGCGLTERSCVTLALALSSNLSSLKELSLDNNNLQDSGVKLLFDGLKNQHCKLETLGLCNCNITHEGCAALVSALNSNPSHLRKLTLGMNNIEDSGVKQLAGLLEDSDSKLEKLELFDCSITEEGCAALASALKSNPSQLRELDLKRNKAGDSGMKLLSALLEDPGCKLEKLNFHT